MEQAQAAKEPEEDAVWGLAAAGKPAAAAPARARPPAKALAEAKAPDEAGAKARGARQGRKLNPATPTTQRRNERCQEETGPAPAERDR